MPSLYLYQYQYQYLYLYMHLFINQTALLATVSKSFQFLRCISAGWRRQKDCLDTPKQWLCQLDHSIFQSHCQWTTAEIEGVWHRPDSDTSRCGIPGIGPMQWNCSANSHQSFNYLPCATGWSAVADTLQCDSHTAGVGFCLWNLTFQRSEMSCLQLGQL